MLVGGMRHAEAARRTFTLRIEHTRRRNRTCGNSQCKHYTKPTHTSHPAHVFSHLSHRVQRNRCVSQNSRSHIKHSTSHAPSLLFPSHLSAASLSTCTPVRLSIRPSTRPSLLSTSHGDLPCADPSNVSFSPVAETQTPSHNAVQRSITNHNTA